MWAAGASWTAPEVWRLCMAARAGGILLELPRIVAIIGGFVKAKIAGEMDEWFKSHAWKACIGS